MERAYFLLLIILFFQIKEYSSQIINISNCSELQGMQINNNTVCYKLIGNINCQGFPFTPIGTNSSFPFRGKIEGQGFSIGNLTISTTQHSTDCRLRCAWLITCWQRAASNVRLGNPVNAS